MERLLADSFSRIDPEIAVHVHGVGSRPGRFLATIESNSTEVAWLPTGWPRQVKDLLLIPDRPGLVAAPELSPGARELLAQEGVSWVDQTGAARVVLPGLYIRVDVGQTPRKPREPLGWTRATLAVSEALLAGTPTTVAGISATTGLAPSTVAASLRFLQEAGLLESDAARGRNSRRTVKDQEQLLDVYADAATQLRSARALRLGVLWRNPMRGVIDLGTRLTAHRVAWSVTGTLAADVLAPYLTETDPWEVYVDAQSPAALRQIAREVGLEESTGGRLLLRPFPTPAKDALSTNAHGQRVAVWARVFADLRMIGVRGEEAAEHLREHMEVSE